jgi:peptide deformylase
MIVSSHDARFGRIVPHIGPGTAALRPTVQGFRSVAQIITPSTAMPLLPILTYPDPRLRNKAQPAAAVDAALRQLAADMAQTMYAAKGIGLAATQVGVARRVVVMDLSADHDQLQVLINPRVIARDGSQVCEEGCLSVPDVYEDVERAERVSVSYLDLDGAQQQMDADGLLAVCVQHEIDHLDGKLFVDYLSRLKQGRLRKKADKRQRDDTRL